MHQTVNGRNTLIVLLIALGGLILFQLLLGSAVLAGYLVEGRTHFLLQDGRSGPLDFPNHKILAWTGLYLLLIGLPLAGLISRLMTRKRPAEFYFLEESWIKLVPGFGAGMAFAVTVIAGLILSGHGRITACPDRLAAQELVASILGFGMLMLLVAIGEEIVFRGVLTREWACRWNGWMPAATISGILFGMLHTLNIQASWIEKYRIVASGLLFSLLLTLIMLSSRSLKAAIGFHAGWNFGLGFVSGVSVSGQSLNPALFKIELAGPEWIIGDRFGLETSGILNGILAAAVLLIWIGLLVSKRLPAARPKSGLAPAQPGPLQADRETVPTQPISIPSLSGSDPESRAPDPGSTRLPAGTGTCPDENGT